MKAAGYDRVRALSRSRPAASSSAWRRDLAAFRPRRLWLGHLLLHRVECLVRVVPAPSAGPFRAALLRQLADAAPLDRLRRGPRAARPLDARPVRPKASSRTAGDWRLTERGRHALESDAYTAASSRSGASSPFWRGQVGPPALLLGAVRPGRGPGAAGGLAIRRRGPGRVRAAAGGVEDAARLPDGRGGRPDAARPERARRRTGGG